MNRDIKRQLCEGTSGGRVLLALGLVVGMTGLVLAQGKREQLKGLVYEAEEWSTPQSAWQLNTVTRDKWRLWTTEPDVWRKRSMGKSLNTPRVERDRATPEEGAPVLHTCITNIPTGIYNVWLNPTGRWLAISLDGGKNWLRAERYRESHLGFIEIKDGRFELWVDDRYANPENYGVAYYDYIRFEAADAPTVSEVKAFTLPDGATQISWISGATARGAVVRYTPDDRVWYVEREQVEGGRNHAVVLTNLVAGQCYKVRMSQPISLDNREYEFKPFEFVAGERPQPPPTVSDRIALQVFEPTAVGRQGWPVTSGVPFAPGRLAAVEQVGLEDAQGRPVEAQFGVTARWPDGSIKWLLCDFQATTTAGKSSDYFLTTAAKGVTRQEDATRRAALERCAREIVARECEATIVLADGTILRAQPADEVRIDDSGALRCALSAGGDYADSAGRRSWRWRAQVNVYGGATPMDSVRWGISNNDTSERTLLVKSATWQRGKGGSAGAVVLGSGERVDGEFRIRQDLETRAVLTQGSAAHDLKKCDGLFMLPQKELVWVRDFWQSWPKGVGWREGRLTVELLPELTAKNYPPVKSADDLFIKYFWYKDGCYQFNRGMEVANDIWLLDQVETVREPQKWREWLEQPLFAHAESEYYCATGAFGAVVPAQRNGFAKYEATFERSFKALEAGRQRRGEYGWMNYGDWFGERRWNWGNNEYDLPYTVAIHFARSGNLDYLRRGIEMARHYTTVDVIHYPQPGQREIVYEHSIGHIGGMLSMDHPYSNLVNLTRGFYNGLLDGSGGHSFQVGNFFMTCLTGDRRFAEVAATACWHQATFFTPNYNFTIERAAGWALINACYAYNFTGNPYYLNAAKLYFEVILAKQNPQTGCFDLPQDQSECDCPDKKQHRGGKAFATGVMLHGLARLYEIEGSPEVKQVITRCADWLLDSAWDKENRGFRYKTGCPKYAKGSGYSLIITEGIAYAGEVSGNPRYREFLTETLGTRLYKGSGNGYSAGKGFAQTHRHLPHLLYYLHQHGIDEGTLEAARLAQEGQKKR